MMEELSFHGMSGMTQALGMFVGVDSVLITVVARKGVVCSWELVVGSGIEIGIWIGTESVDVSCGV